MNWGVLIVLAGFLLHLNIIGYLYSYNLLHIQLKESFNSTATEAALPGSVSIAFYAVSSLIVTWIFQRFGDRPAGFLGITLCCVGLLTSSFVQEIWMLCLTYGVLYGFGCNAIHLVTIDMIVKYYKGIKSTRCIGITMTASSIGVLFSPCLEWLYTTFQWRISLRILSGVFAIVCIPCMSLFKEKKDNGTPRNIVTQKQENKTRRNMSLFQKYIEMVRIPAFLCLVCSYAMSGIATTFSFVSIGSFLTESGLSGTQTSLILSTMGAGDLVARVSVSLLSQWLPISITSLYAIGHIVSASSMLSLPYAINATVIMVILIVFSVSRGIIFVLIASAPIEIAPVHSSVESVGLVYLVFGMCALSAPYITDNVYDIKGSYNSAFFICCALYACSSFFLFAAVHLNKKNMIRRNSNENTDCQYNQMIVNRSEEEPTEYSKEVISRVTVI